jgi:hypothetical protein
MRSTLPADGTKDIRQAAGGPKVRRAPDGKRSSGACLYAQWISYGSQVCDQFIQVIVGPCVGRTCR